MPVSNSRLSYADCFTLFDKALDDTKGARYQVGNGEEGANRYFVMRMHQARSLDRQDNKILHSLGDHLYGRSVYDPLICQLKQDTKGGWWVYVTHTEIDEALIESLSEVPLIEGDYTVVEQIEYSKEPALATDTQLLITDQTIRRRV